jgi:hypothetical protein
MPTAYYPSSYVIPAAQAPLMPIQDWKYSENYAYQEDLRIKYDSQFSLPVSILNPPAFAS